MPNDDDSSQKAQLILLNQLEKKVLELSRTLEKTGLQNSDAMALNGTLESMLDSIQSVTKPDVQLTTYSIADVLCNVEKEYAQVSVRIEGELPPLVGRPSKLQRVLENMVTNSLQANADNIAIHARYEQGIITIVTVDDGDGMMPAQQEQALRGVSTKHPGKGKGLDSAKRLAAMYEGTVSVSSVPTIGTGIVLSFYQTTPIQHAEYPPSLAIHDLRNSMIGVSYLGGLSGVNRHNPEWNKQVESIIQLLRGKREEESSRKREKTAYQDARILVIEDTRVCGMVASAYLSRGGYHVDVVGDLETAAEVFERAEKTQPYEVIILDDQVKADRKGRSACGLEFLDTMRRLTTRKVPVVSCAANDLEHDDDYREKGEEYREKGVEHFLKKPYQQKELLTTVGTVLSRIERT